MTALFKTPKLPQQLPQAEPTPLPTTDDAKVMAARKKVIAEQKARQGRQSTILSQDETLGG